MINKKSSLVSLVDRAPVIEIVEERVSFRNRYHGRRLVPTEIKEKKVIAKYNHIFPNSIEIYLKKYVKNAEAFGEKISNLLN